MNAELAQTYFRFYRALVGAAYLLHQGNARTYALLRAWSYYARPVVDTLWEEDADPLAEETAHQLMGWLLWLKGLDDPEAFFRSLQSKRQPPYQLGWRIFRTEPRN